MIQLKTPEQDNKLTLGIYLGLIADGVEGKQDIYLFKVLSLTAKKDITKSWLKTELLAGHCRRNSINGINDLQSTN